MTPNAILQSYSINPEAIVNDAFRSRGVHALLADLVAGGSGAALVGGAVRDILSNRSPQDLDLIAPNGDCATHRVLSRWGKPVRNRHGNWRYQIGAGLHVDVIEPRFFYRSFEKLSDALAFFDASINAIGIYLNRYDVEDPIGGLRDFVRGEVRLPLERWRCMSDFESVHLALRLTRLIERTALTVNNPEVALAHLPKFATVDWTDLARLNGVDRTEGRRRFLACFGMEEASVQQRAQF